MAVDESEVETGHHVGWKVTVVALPPNYAEAQYGAQSHPRTKHDVNAEAEIARDVGGGGRWKVSYKPHRLVLIFSCYSSQVPVAS